MVVNLLPKIVGNIANIREFSNDRDDGKSEMLNDSRLFPTFTRYSLLQLMYMCTMSIDESFTEQLTDSSYFKFNCHDQHSCYLHRLYMDFSQPLQAELPWQWWDLPYKCAISCIVWSLSISTTYVIRDFYVPRNLCIEIFWYQLRPVVTNYGLIFLVTDVIPPDCHLQRLSPGETEAVPSNAVRVTTESLSRFAVPVSTSST